MSRELLDANVMLGARPGGDAPDLTIVGLRSTMVRLDITGALVRHADAVFYDAGSGNLTLAEQIADIPELMPAFVLGPIDCGEHGGPDGLRQHLDAHDVQAVWLYPAAHGWSVRGPESRSLLASLATANRPVFVDLDECSWADVEHLAAQLPDVGVVVCDTGYRTLRQAYAVMSRHRNVHLDTSHLAAAGGLEEMIGHFGANRFCFGTGAPVHDPGGAMFHFAMADVGGEGRRELASGTLIRLTGSGQGMSTVGEGGANATADGAHRQSTGVHASADEAALLRARWGAAGIVDAHAHIGLWPSSWVPRGGSEHLLNAMERTGTQVSLVSSLRAIWSGTVAEGNAEAIAVARRHEGRVYAYVVANPHRPQDAGQLGDLLGQPEVCGIKVHPHTHSLALDDPRYDWVFEMAETRCVPVLGHSFEGTWHSSTELFGSVAARRPGLTLIAGHAGATPEGFRAMIRRADQHTNLYAELCGSKMSAWWVRQLVDALGPTRVLHGTDSTLIDARYAVGRVLDCDLDPAERDFVLRANARRLFHLGTNHRRSG